MRPDFTLDAYARILHATLESGYQTLPVVDWLQEEQSLSSYALILRHDVDRRPYNALAMAELESRLGIRSTYYFRIVPASFNPEVIGAISDLGHEIGYHYEDWDRAGGDPDLARSMFAEALENIRQIAPVHTISMHGSPLAKENNMKLWDYCSFTDFTVSDCLLSHSWSGFAYFTDSGRTFGTSSANLRDVLGESDTPAGVDSSADITDFIRNRARAHIMLSTHPERWSNRPTIWIRQFCWDFCANTAKRLIKLIRRSTA